MRPGVARMKSANRHSNPEGTLTMTAITTIRIDHATLPDPLNLKDPDTAARLIQTALRDESITADASDVISHIKIELPTSQLVAASAMLANLQLI